MNIEEPIEFLYSESFSVIFEILLCIMVGTPVLSTECSLSFSTSFEIQEGTCDYLLAALFLLVLLFSEVLELTILLYGLLTIELYISSRLL